ncbi:hypothetical protein ACFYO0_45185 [Streptomyces sp. NPDC006365]|uniref:hypothetical protein n=1 Tax=Streptomyces sp. NPDC006365 TaxID=3364744 RepID=UPI0036780A5D
MFLVVEEEHRHRRRASGILEVLGQAALVRPPDEGGVRAPLGGLGLGEPDVEVGLCEVGELDLLAVDPLHELDRSADLVAIGTGGVERAAAAVCASARVADDEPLGEGPNDLYVCGGQVFGRRTGR